MTFSELVRGRTVALTPLMSSSYDIEVPGDLGILPEALRTAVEKLLAAQDAASTAQRAKRRDRHVVQAAEEAVSAALQDAIDVSVTTADSAGAAYATGHAVACRKYARALEAAVAALAEAGIFAQLHETAASQPARLGLSYASRAKGYGTARALAESIERLPAPAPLDA
ncbi:MAG: hypothetical protein JWO67_1949 [Streptosporangiaceae bacterium]|nr:hypothetical protein [Streptosporangiaceae bacterium]